MAVCGGALSRVVRCASAGVLAVALFAVTAAGCSRPSVTARDFVGEWKSSRLVTPLVMRDDGTWEIREADGHVLQYGVWQYKDERIMWSYKVDGQIGHDINPVVSVKPREFKLRERDGTVSTFERRD